MRAFIAISSVILTLAIVARIDAATLSSSARAVDNTLYNKFLCRFKANGFKAIVPGSCSQYYQCENGVSRQFSCPRYFDAKTGTCVFNNPGCVEVQYYAPKYVACTGPCCGITNGYAVSSTNPAEYYKCSNENIISTSYCPSGQAFNLVKLCCDIPSNCSPTTSTPPPCDVTTPSPTTTTTCAPPTPTPCTPATTTPCITSTMTSYTTPPTQAGTTLSTLQTTRTTTNRRTTHTTRTTITPTPPTTEIYTMPTTSITISGTTPTTTTCTTPTTTTCTTPTTTPCTTPTTTTCSTPTTTTCTTASTTTCTTPTTTTCTTPATETGTTPYTTFTQTPITTSTSTSQITTSTSPTTTTRSTIPSTIQTNTPSNTPTTTTCTTPTTTTCTTPTTTTCTTSTTTTCTTTTSPPCHPPTTPPCTTTVAPACLAAAANPQPLKPDMYVRPAKQIFGPSHVLAPQSHESNMELYARFACRGKENGFMLASLRSCNEYYICRNEQALRVSCGDKYFNALKGICDLPENTRCIQPFQLKGN